MRTFHKLKLVNINKFYKGNRFFVHNQIISSKDLNSINDKLFIDLRSKEDFEKCHIKNAVNIPQFFTYLAESSHTGLEKLTDTFKGLLQSKGVTGKENLIFYEDHLGSLKGVSCRAYFLMSMFGYNKTKLYILEEGLDGVKAKKSFPVEEGAERKIEKLGTFVPQLNEDHHIRYDELHVSLTSNDKKPFLLDVRDEEEWIGVSSSPYGPDFTPRKGRLIGAKSIIWTEFMEDKKKFKTEEEIDVLCKTVGIKDKEQEIVVYCFKGCRSSNSLIALKKAGYKNVRNYLGSWNEWSRNLKLPIDDSKL